MLKVNHLCVAVLSTVFSAVAVRGQGCRQVVNGFARFVPGTRAIAEGAFQRCLALKEVVIPATVETVGDDAFANTEFTAINLERVTFAPGSRVTSLGQRAFAYNNKVQAIVLPNGLKTLGRDVFKRARINGGLATASLEVFTDDYDPNNPNNEGNEGYDYSYSQNSGLRSIFIPQSIITNGTVSDFFDGTCLERPPLLEALNTFLGQSTKSDNFIVCDCREFTGSINMCPALNQLLPVTTKGKAKGAKTGKIDKVAKTAKAEKASFTKTHKATNAQGGTVNSDSTSGTTGTLQVQSNPFSNPNIVSTGSYTTMGVLPQNICSALSNDGGAEDKVFNPVVGMCYDLTGNWWRNNIDQISGGGGAVCVDVWEGGYQVGRHQRTCAAAWVATEFAVSHICCTENYEESGVDSLYLTRNEDAAPTCAAQADGTLFSPALGMCYDLANNWWDNKIEAIRGGSATACIDVWEGDWGEGRHMQWCRTDWVPVEFPVSHVCCTDPNSDAENSFGTRSEETQSQEATAQVQIQQEVPASGTCGAKVDDQLFSPEMGKCFDLTGNWWDNKIQLITGGGAGVCVDVWESGYQEGAHQQVCGTDWRNTFFPVSHLCCNEETTTATPPSIPASGTCGAKVEEHLFSPELGQCYDLTNNWWDNKIQTISGGTAGVCVDVWELGFQTGAHQQVCGASWTSTSFPISHLCCREE